MRTWIPCALLCGAALGQAPSVAHTLYQKIAPSVLVLEVHSAAGEVIALGSGFVISEGRVVTNAHVCNAGEVYVEVGPAKIPAQPEAKDVVNDLCILKVGAELGSKPLSLAAADPSPGDTIYVLGNPEGLSRTISSGLVSAVRTLDGKPAIQISAAISHGSSGSPVLNSEGEVVGVVSSMLSEGQNLNFAVPVRLLNELLTGGGTSPGFQALLAAAAKLDQRVQTDTFSSDPASPFIQDYKTLDGAYLKALAAAGSNYADVHTVYLKSPIASEAKLKAASAEVGLRDNADSESDLASALDGPQSYAAALAAVNRAVAMSTSPGANLYALQGEILNDNKEWNAADAAFRRARAISPQPSDPGYVPKLLRGLTLADYHLGRYAESNAWFQSLAAAGHAIAFDWEQQAQRLVGESDWADAAAAYQQAATLADQGSPAFYPAYSLWQSTATSFQVATQPDAELAAARHCVGDGTGKQDASVSVAACYVDIAEVLNSRAVYGAALQEANQAVALDPTYAWAYDEQAVADEGLQQYQDGITAEQTALSLSDGKFADMHFRLGNLYFDQQDWQQAGESFQQAAQIDKSDAASAYNAGLCLAKQGDNTDALPWFQEVLKRNPDADLRSKTEREISLLDRILGVQ